MSWWRKVLEFFTWAEWMLLVIVVALAIWMLRR